MTLTHEAIGERLKEARKNVHLSQEATATAIGIDRTALVKIEKGTRTVTGVELHLLAQLYRRDPSEFLVDQPLQKHPLTILGRMEKNAPVEWSKQVSHNL
ncbi:helix-turn-helix transcriptional regulator [Moorena sp. SIO3H5]|uniref:helix-turn-helix domain-containing protein n=1 Tax=Moorena sp. SIO3H5 TaxID=2607834 RepID=UPI0013B93C11|nr:helix-turn-helix transcriptional regulator [Moorena sp. SIO3H5]NEO71790.1 helix-turn-helix transcriptional regulator [Moorena sp. SIO3H5]